MIKLNSTISVLPFALMVHGSSHNQNPDFISRA
jgi:hypothetical protein